MTIGIPSSSPSDGPFDAWITSTGHPDEPLWSGQIRAGMPAPADVDARDVDVLVIWIRFHGLPPMSDAARSPTAQSLVGVTEMSVLPA